MKTDEPNSLPSKGLTRQDAVLAAILAVLSGLIFVESWTLTFGIELPGIEENAWRVAPGLLPLILSAGLMFMLCGLSLVAFNNSRKHQRQAWLNTDLYLTLGHVALLCIYVFGLIGLLPFSVASALYLISAMSLARAASWPIILGLSTGFSLTVSLVFGRLMNIPLP